MAIPSARAPWHGRGCGGQLGVPGGDARRHGVPTALGRLCSVRARQQGVVDASPRRNVRAVALLPRAAERRCDGAREGRSRHRVPVLEARGRAAREILPGHSHGVSGLRRHDPEAHAPERAARGVAHVAAGHSAAQSVRRPHQPGTAASRLLWAMWVASSTIQRIRSMWRTSWWCSQRHALWHSLFAEALLSALLGAAAALALRYCGCTCRSVRHAVSDAVRAIIVVYAYILMAGSSARVNAANCAVAPIRSPACSTAILRCDCAVSTNRFLQVGLLERWRVGGRQDHRRGRQTTPRSRRSRRASTASRTRCRVRAAERPQRRRSGAVLIQRITRVSSSSSPTSRSANVRPRTEMPARCTVSGSPDTSGCHHSSGLPSATRR